LVLALFFAGIHPSDKVAAFSGLMIWLASVWLTYLIARRWFGTNAAIWATVFFATNAAALQSAATGLPFPLLTIWLVLALGITLEVCLQEKFSKVRIFLAGFTAALAFLTSFNAGVLAAAAGMYVVFSRRERIPAMIFFVAGLLLPLIPWLWFNARQTNSP